MPNLVALEPVDYLVIGHLTCDVTSGGSQLGGSAAYAALTARAMGLRVGVVTAWGNEIPLDALEGIPILASPAGHSTTFENISTPEGRLQYLHHRAPDIAWESIPPAWRRAPVVHVAPVAGELSGGLPESVQPGLLGLTLQGWLRSWDERGQVLPRKWDGPHELLRDAGAAVVSLEDVGRDEEQIDALVQAARLLVVTEGPDGARLYWNGDQRRFRAPRVEEVDPTGAGDVFAAAFFGRLQATRDPWEAARFATQVAAVCVTRPGLQGVPTREEIQAGLVEVLR